MITIISNDINNYIKNRLFLSLFILMSFHAVIAIVFFVIANSEHLSHLHNGAGIWNFARDATLYHKESIDMVSLLRNYEWIAWWLSYPYHQNVKLISLTYWLTGYSVPISFEIVNAMVWSLSVILIYKAADLMFSNNIVSALSIMFFFQPSVLMSSTQLLRDPIFILGISFMCYGWMLLAKTEHNKWRWVISLQIGLLLFLTMRFYLGPVIVTIFYIYLVYILYSKGNITTTFQVLFLLIPLMLSQFTYQHAYIAPALNSKNHISEQIPPEQTSSSTKPITTPPNLLDRLSLRLSAMRFGFSNVNSYAGSKIDESISYDGFFEAVKYFPRVVQISFLSPFPKHWISKGRETGRIGRILAGIEMIAWYMIIAGFIYIIFHEVSLLSPLIPMIILSIFVIILLGYVVPNVGAIFRMRQGFMIPFFIIGSYGIYTVTKQITAKYLHKR